MLRVNRQAGNSVHHGQDSGRQNTQGINIIVVLLADAHRQGVLVDQSQGLFSL